MTAARLLKLEAPPAPDRIMDAAEISREKFHGKKSARWVREHITDRIPGSREALWFESVVDDFIVHLRKESTR